MTIYPLPQTASRIAVFVLISSALSACGGGSSSDPSSASDQATVMSVREASMAVSNVSTSATTTASSTGSTTVTVALEGATFAVSGTQAVKYGAGTSWIQKSVTNSGQCTNAYFGNDPAYGSGKSCQLVNAPATTNATKLAAENGSFAVTGTQTVQFGAGSSWIQMQITGTAQCNNTFFGFDPDYGISKSCILIPAPVSTASSTTLATEGGIFTVTGTQTVLYGAGTSWIQVQVTGSGQCSNAFFGSDPDYGVVKSCHLATTSISASSATSTGSATLATAATAATTATTATATTTATTATAATPANTVTAWVRVGYVGDTLTLPKTQVVRFGDGNNWVSATLSNGASCTPASFSKDPSPYTNEFCETQVTAPGVVQTGLAPVINAGLMPAAAASYTSPRVATLTAYQLASPGYTPTASDLGAFREPCHFSHMNYDDPIVYPGKPSATHLHTYMGNDSVNSASTATSIESSGGSTCAGGTVNRSGYWMPTIIDTRTGQPVPPSGGSTYYKSGYQGIVPGMIKAFPSGLRMVSGSADATVATPSLARFACVSQGNWQSGIPSCAPGDIMEASVTFPQCWDGVNLDSPDHKSHMAYGTGVGCPADHPVALPEVTMHFDYMVGESNTGTFWKLSSDNYAGQGGYSLHADWFGGWDTATINAFLTSCINASMDCHDYLLGDGRQVY